MYILFGDVQLFIALGNHQTESVRKLCCDENRAIEMDLEQLNQLIEINI